MSILHNCHKLVDTYLPMMNGIVFTKMGKNVSAVISPTRISMLQMLGLVFFFNTHIGLAE